MMVDFSFPLAELEYFLLILVRISAFVMVAPFFGQNHTPNMLKVAFSVFVSVVLYETITPHVYPEYYTLLDYTALILEETLIGLLIGLMANFAMQISAFAGQIVDTDIGFSMAAQMDPVTMQNTTVTGYLYQYAFMLIFLVTGMHRYLLQALAQTFTLIPTGQLSISAPLMYGAFLNFMTEYVMIGFQISLPIFCATLILNGLLGIMAKVSPQMNMFAVGIQIKALTGMAVLFVTMRLLPDAADLVFTEMRTVVARIIAAMGGAV